MAISRISPSEPPTAQQLAVERATHFAQDGQALLTTEAARAWLGRVGLALYGPRPDQITAPAPCFLEATAGAATSEPTSEQQGAARDLLVRLITEGAAVPLNLFGATTSDLPDFVCSPAVFSFLFTLRGNKAWKAAPTASGPVRVSPLAVNTYELLTEKVTLTAGDLATHLGKEVTEAAVLRALCELWQQLRVLPVPQSDGSATLWELASARFTKQIKAGANAGQPTALSALISLYLQQVVAATEDEVETFLSPLAPRSRLRSIMHDLLAARQLETVVVDGKTLVYVSGALPSFQLAAPSQPKERAEDATPGENETGSEGAGRISKFTPDPASKLGKGLRVRPAFGKRPGYGSPAGGRERRPFAARSNERGLRPDEAAGSRPPRSGAGRPFRSASPAFDKPWAEKRPARPAQGEGEAISASGEPRQRPDQRPESRESRPQFGAPRPRFGAPRPQFGEGARPSFRDRPRREEESAPREGSADRPRPFAPRQGSGGPGGRRDGAGFAGTNREGGRRPFTNAGDRPPRPFRERSDRGGDARSGQGAAGGFQAKRSFAPRSDGGGLNRRPDGAGGVNKRPDGAAGFSKRPFRPSSEGDRRGTPGAGAAGEARRPFAARPERTSGQGRPSFGGRPGAGRPDFPRREGASRAEGNEGSRPSFRRFDAPQGARSFDGTRSPGRQRDSRSGENRSFAPRRDFSGKPGGKKPFAKGLKSAGSGGFSPVRKRPEEEA